MANKRYTNNRLGKRMNVTIEDIVKGLDKSYDAVMKDEDVVLSPNEFAGAVYGYSKDAERSAQIKGENSGMIAGVAVAGVSLLIGAGIVYLANK